MNIQIEFEHDFWQSYVSWTEKKMSNFEGFITYSAINEKLYMY